MTPALKALLDLARELPSVMVMESAGAIYKKGFEHQWSKTHIALKSAEPDLLELVKDWEHLNSGAMRVHNDWMRIGTDLAKVRAENKVLERVKEEYKALEEKFEKLRSDTLSIRESYSELLKDRERLEFALTAPQKIIQMTTENWSKDNLREAMINAIDNALAASKGPQ